MKKNHKRHYLLLEVMIAFAIVAMCVLPLIAPHVFILKEQKSFVQKVELDHLVNLIYADIIERLYRNDISWAEVTSEKFYPIDESLLNRVGWTSRLPYQGEYQFKIDRYKPKKQPAPYTLFLLDLTIRFVPPETAKEATEKEKTASQIKYEYKVFVERNIGGEGAAESEQQTQGAQQDQTKGGTGAAPAAK